MGVLSRFSLALSLTLLLALIACADGVSDEDVSEQIDRALSDRLPRALDEALDDRAPALAATITAGVSATAEASQPTATSVPATATAAPLPGETPTPGPSPTPVPDPTATPLPGPGPAPTATPTPTATPDPTDPVERSRGSIVRIETPHGNGTGVIVESSASARTAKVLTNAHVTAGAVRLDVVVSGGQRYQGRILGEDTRRDLALVEICCSANFRSVTHVDSLTVTPGQTVGILGYRNNGASAVRLDAVVLDTRFNGGRDRVELVLDTVLEAGMSGSAVLLPDGRLLGLGTYSSTSGATGEPGFGFGISQTTIAAALPSLKSGPFAVAGTVTPPQPGAGAPVFGPQSGELTHNPEAPQIVRSSASLDVSDAVISATFTNPYPHSEAPWSYGFEFRSKGTARHTLFIRSRGSWTHWINDAAGNPVRVVDQRDSPLVHTTGGTKNTVRVVAFGSQGWLFINNQYAGALNLLGLEDFGDVSVITGVLSGDQRDGFETVYEDFTVTAVGTPVGPAAGALVRETPGFIATRGAGLDFVDSMTTARFFNPPADGGNGWTYGFLVRRSDVNTFHAVLIDNTGKWHHHVRDGSTTTDRRLRTESSSAISTSASGSNTLRLIVSGPVGALFINGTFAGTIDLSALPGGGDVSLIAGYFNTDQVVGTETRFEDFTVRPLR